MALLKLLRGKAAGQLTNRGFAPFTQSFFSTSDSPSVPIKATLFPGDGIGPEIAESVKQVLSPAVHINLCLDGD